MAKGSSRGGLVYSTELGRTCPHCGQALAACLCDNKSTPVQGDGRVRVSRETKGRKGKGVSLISGLPLAEPELKSLAKALKKRCGVGGAVKEGVIEIQGDQRDILVAELQKRGFDARKSGG